MSFNIYIVIQVSINLLPIEFFLVKNVLGADPHSFYEILVVAHYKVHTYENIFFYILF